MADQIKERVQQALAEQKAADEAKAENFAKLRAESEAKRATRDVDRAVESQRQREAAQERKEAPMKAAAKGAWIANGGTEAEFDEQWPTLRLAMLQQQAVNAAAPKANPRRVGL